MVVFKWFLLVLFLSFQTFAQFDWFENQKRFYIYTPSTDTAININNTFATLIGYDNKVKSTKFDTLATKKPIQRWLVIVGVDSLGGKTRTFTGLTGGTEYTYYYSIFVQANDGDVDYYKGENKTFTTLTMLAGTYITTEVGKYWTNENGKFITVE